MRNAQLIYDLVALIPEGRVVSYGAVGRATPVRFVPVAVGRWMALSKGLPWWRVVGADGRLPLAKQDAGMALMQQQKLSDEGVEFDDEVMPRRYFLTPEELMDLASEAFGAET